MYAQATLFFSLALVGPLPEPESENNQCMKTRNTSVSVPAATAATPAATTSCVVSTRGKMHYTYARTYVDTFMQINTLARTHHSHTRTHLSTRTRTKIV